MPVVKVFCCGALVLCWTCAALTVSDPTPRHAPCYVEDIFAALRESVGDDGELTSSSFTQFGVCPGPDSPSGSVLLELAQEKGRNQRRGLEVLHPTGVLVTEEEDTGALELTFDLPPSPLLMLSHVLLLVFQSPPKGEDLEVTFSSPSLQPHTQSVCISAETEYTLLTGNASDASSGQKWRISVEAKSPDLKQNLKDILIGEKSGSSINITPLLLFSGGTETSRVSGSTLSSSQTFSFLCELRRFLCEVLPQNRPEAPQLQLGSLQSVPYLSLGLSSSETLLAGLINSSSTTVFSFSRWGSVLQVHPGQLALSPSLLEELRQRVEQIGMQMMEVIGGKEVGSRAKERLGRLKELSALPKTEPGAGENQYRAFLLLKALQTVARSYELQIGQRTPRAGSTHPARGNFCSLRSLTVSLEKHLMGPNTAVINNCRGSCLFPMLNTNNHAVLLNSHIESGNAEERGPCCVPVAYESLEVVDLNEHGTFLSIKPDVVARECGCR
ncbi:muellerian-inhibiting factor [Limanda limanda]|uniref:muellerian-inhibiting factor n=1 Tax=Limanda limanda TaxID=27771 RepID=UPI0029C64C12|nr:muellerian-inhibiting factor [Limanda limanda]